MRVFVTGATGWVGATVVEELIGAGHTVLGLARSDAGAATLAASGAEVVRGSIEDFDMLGRAAAGADGVIHTAFNHDFSKFVENSAADRAAIEALGRALEGSDRPLLVTSGLAFLADGRLADEDDLPHPVSTASPRASELAAAALAERGVRVSSIRLSPSVHGAGDHGFVAMLIGIARTTGVSVYAGDGANRWPGVHRIDAARLYRLALERGASEARYHAVAEEGVPFRAIAEAIGRGLGVPTLSKSPEEAAAHFGWFARFAAIDAPSSSARTRALLGWEPTQIGLIDDIDRHYFG